MAFWDGQLLDARLPLRPGWTLICRADEDRAVADKANIFQQCGLHAEYSLKATVGRKLNVVGQSEELEGRDEVTLGGKNLKTQRGHEMGVCA